MTAQRPRLVFHVFVAAVTATVVAAVEGAVRATMQSGSGVHSITAPVATAMGSVALLSVCIGVGQWLAVMAFAKYAARTGLSDRWRAVNDRTAEDRGPVIRAHVLGFYFAFGIALTAVTLWLGALAVESVQDAALARSVLVVSIVGCQSFVAFGILVTWPFAVRAFTRLDGPLRLPFPASPTARWLFVALPVGGALLAVLVRYHDVLGPAFVPIALMLFFVIEGALSMPLRRPLVAPKSRFLMLFVFASVGVAAVLCPLYLDRSPAAVRAAQAGLVNSSALAILRRVADVDRDGVAGTYGGGDCAPFNARIGPGSIDRPGNGVDEDCDGRDAGKGALARQPVFSGAWSQPESRKFNILWIVADALRPDHMQVYGYERKNTPYLADFAPSALVFERAYVQATTTHLSIPSMLIGKNTAEIRWSYLDDTTRVQIADEETTLTERLKRLGYRTGAVVGSHIMRLDRTLQGFDFREKIAPSQGSPRSTWAALQFISEGIHAKRARPFFLLAYFEDAHAPYQAHGRGEPRFGNSEMDRYDTEIAYVDRYIGLLLEQIRYHRDLWNDTVVIVTADHGEEFGDHGRNGHGKNCHRETMHVPLMIRIPGVAGREIGDPVALIDVVPTLLELVGETKGTTGLSGTSLLGYATADGKGPAPRPIHCTILNQGSMKISFYDSAVRLGDRVLIRHRVEGRSELYDSATDRDETNDLSSVPAERQTLKRLESLVVAGERGGNLWSLRLP